MKRFLKVAPAVVFFLACGGGASRTVIQNRGSDTLVNVAQAWAEAYGRVNPSVAVAVTGGGSGTGISAMINGTIDIANASRAMRESELEDARSRGVDPIEHVVGFDALAVFVHPDNPMAEFTIAQLAGVYVEGGQIADWSQLGVEVPGCSSGEIIRVSRQNNSGTYAYFQEAVLGSAEFALGSRDMNGSSEVVELVANTPCAIGYSGLAYATDHVAMPCVSAEEGAACVAPSTSSAVDGSYPIARPLLMYTAGEPTGAIGEYMSWIKSAVGQCIILNKGYAPAEPVECA